MLLTVLLTVNSQEIKRLPEDPPEWWYKMNDHEKYKLLRATHDIAVEQNIKLGEMNNQSKINIEEDEKTLKNIEKNRKFLEDYNPFYPKWGFSFGATGLLGIDKNYNIVDMKNFLQTDLIINIDFYKFFWKGRVFIRPGLNLKVYENVSGGLSFSLGFIFK